MRKFEFVSLDQLAYDLETLNTDAGRRYVTPEGKHYPSITTVLSKNKSDSLLEWRKRVGEEQANKISRMAANRGTNLHNVFEKYLLNEMSEFQLKTMMPNIKALFQQMRPFLDQNLGKIYCLEQALYSDEYGIAGRVDCIAEWNGTLSVIDFKTSNKEKLEEHIENYFVQCTAYSMMFEERTNIPIDQIVVLICTEEEIPQVFVKHKYTYVSRFKDILNNYFTDVV